MADVREIPGCRRGLVGVGRLRPGDRDAVLAVFDGLSERSRRLRYHGPKPRLAEREVDRLLDVGCCGREAVAAIDLVSGDVVGIARFVRDQDDPGSAEVAFEVVDACHSSGVGRRLMDELQLGDVVRSSYADGAYELEVALAA